MMLNKVEKQVLDNEILELHNRLAEHSVELKKAYADVQKANRRLRDLENAGHGLDEELRTKTRELENFYNAKSEAIAEALNAG